MAEKKEISLVDRLREFMENEARSCSMDLTLSKSLTLGKTQVNLALLSLNRDFRLHNTSLRIQDVGRCGRDGRY